MKITLVKGIGFIINLVWTGWGQGSTETQTPACLFWPGVGVRQGDPHIQAAHLGLGR